MKAKTAGAHAVTLWVAGTRAEDLRLRRITQASWSWSTHPLALWSRGAGNSNWSWSTLGEVKESRGEGPDAGGNLGSPLLLLERIKVQRPSFQGWRGQAHSGKSFDWAVFLFGFGGLGERVYSPASEPDSRKETLSLHNQACQG